jgi:predicted glycogen debranching enzyme
MSSTIRRVPFTGAGAEPPELLAEREWLLTNGLGGYASGTLTGAIARRYHGLLVAALPAPMGRVVMLSQIAEELSFAGGMRVEFCSGVGSQDIGEMPGFSSLVEFRLEDGLPVWLYHIGDLALEKRLLLLHGHNTVLVSYTLLSAAERARLKLRPLLHFRRHEEALSALKSGYEFRSGEQEFAIGASGFPALHILLRSAVWSHTVDESVIRDVYYRMEHQRGYEAFGDLWSPGFFEVDLTRNQAVTLIASAEDRDRLRALSPERARTEECARRRQLLAQASPAARSGVAAELVLAADQFLIRPPTGGGDGQGQRPRRTIIAGYHWFTDWGRDTMISLEGLTLITGRQQGAREILTAFAGTIKDGLIPNLFPEGAREALYHTADASLWFFHAIDRYVENTGDREVLASLLPKLLDILEYHLRGTRFGIGVDGADGLLRQGQQGYQLTWMDAKVGDWVVTPRRGKAVEINALWYNALCLAAGWLRAQGSGVRADELEAHARHAWQSFNARFWYEGGGYLYDVVDGEKGDDSACRPNQIIALSLRYPVLRQERWRRVLEVVKERLLTPYGLRSLSPDHPDYKEKYFGDLRSRDAAYHQGTVWAWLIGPFIDAWLRVHPGDYASARSFLNGLIENLADAGIGTISEVFDAEPPFRPRGCIAQAWSVAEALRCWVKSAYDDTVRL